MSHNLAKKLSEGILDQEGSKKLSELFERMNTQEICTDQAVITAHSLINMILLLEQNNLEGRKKYSSPVLKDLSMVWKQARKELKKRCRDLIADQCKALAKEGVRPKMEAVPSILSSEFPQSGLQPFSGQLAPLVIKGFCSGTQATKTWSPLFFKENYGDHVCTLKFGKKQVQGTVADAVDDILNEQNDGRYVNNLADIFNEHRHLEDELELKRLIERLNPGKGSHLGTQLFLGGKGTSTFWHCANLTNFFLNIYGRKEWYFAHPSYGAFLSGEMYRTGSVGHSPVDSFTESMENHLKYPMYRMVKRYKVVLEPGDLLISPPWWWHAVINRSGPTIGCAVRWLEGEKHLNSGYAFSALQSLLPLQAKVWSVVQGEEFRVTDDAFLDTLFD